MAPQTVTVTVKYSKPGTQPPIYLAGSFSDPEWQPQEMEFTTGENNEHEFHKKVEVEQGKEYQYKFRLGPGDWWTLNEDSPTVTDDIGNKNNLLSIPKVQETIAETEESKPTTQELQAEQAEPASTPAMEKETTPSLEETMGTRETDDTLFADEITKDTEEPKQEQKAPAIEGRLEPHSTPAIPEKPQAEHFEEVKHIKELQDIGGTDTSTSKLVDEEVIEPIPTPLVNIKKFQDLEDTDSKDVSDIEEDKAVAPPVLVVESAKPEDKEDEKADMEEATTNGHGSDHLLTADVPNDDSSRVGAHTPELASVAAEVADTAATLDREQPTPPVSDEKADMEEPTTNGHGSDHLLTADVPKDDISRVGAHTPELASVAAEVADSAATLDREQSTPPISDDEAGRIGYRRMSLTPIPQVASTAAEVADVAAIIDKEPEEEEPREFIRPFDIDDGDLPETPPNEKVPRFSHELCTPPDHQKPAQQEEFDPYEGMRPRKEEEIDLNDPSIQMFPSDRAGILEHLRRMQERLPEDEVKHEDLDLAPPSPVVGPDGRSGRLNLPAVSPVILAQRSPSLDSIPEQNDEGNDLLGAKLVKLNGEDKLVTNGITVPKEEFDAVIEDDISAPKKENEIPLLEPEKKTRGLNGSVDGSDELAVEASSEEPEAEGTEANVAVAEDSAKGDPTEPLQTTDKELVAESQVQESQGTASADTDKAENPIPEVKTPEIPAEEHVTQHGSEESMDGVCHDDEQVKEATSKDIVPGHEHPDKSTTKDDSPDITVSPATPSSSNVTDTTVKQKDFAKSTAIQGENDEAQANLRKRQPSPARSVARSATGNSMRSGSGKDTKDIKGGNMLRYFFRLIFVEYIGGFFQRLCGARRRRRSTS